MLKWLFRKRPAELDTGLALEEARAQAALYKERMKRQLVMRMQMQVRLIEARHANERMAERLRSTQALLERVRSVPEYVLETMHGENVVAYNRAEGAGIAAELESVTEALGAVSSLRIASRVNTARIDMLRQAVRRLESGGHDERVVELEIGFDLSTEDTRPSKIPPSNKH